MLKCTRGLEYINSNLAGPSVGQGVRILTSTGDDSVQVDFSLYFENIISIM